MAATAAQLAMVQRVDPVLYQDQLAQSVLDAEITDAAALLLPVQLAATVRTRAIALLAVHRIRVALPGVANIGGPITGTSDATGSRSFDTSMLPPGFPPDLYRTSAGQQLIGIFTSSTAVGLPMVS